MESPATFETHGKEEPVRQFVIARFSSYLSINRNLLQHLLRAFLPQHKKWLADLLGASPKWRRCKLGTGVKDNRWGRILQPGHESRPGSVATTSLLCMAVKLNNSVLCKVARDLHREEAAWVGFCRNIFSSIVISIITSGRLPFQIHS